MRVGVKKKKKQLSSNKHGMQGRWAGLSCDAHRTLQQSHRCLDFGQTEGRGRRRGWGLGRWEGRGGGYLRPKLEWFRRNEMCEAKVTNKWDVSSIQMKDSMQMEGRKDRQQCR